ncbi:MAG TPA: hypothetical protein PK308_00165 [Phycisphaerales bacterium]|nr:hypothetical protein [Phycisphaerales bacterium]
MRRIAAFLVLMAVAVAGRLNAQAVTCTQSLSTRTIQPATKGAQFANGVLKSWYVVYRADSQATTCRGFPAATTVHDTVTVTVHDTVYVPVKDSVPTPPKDTTPPPPPPPPADTTPASGSAVLFRSDFSGGLLDGGKWTRWGDNGILAVVPAPAGFPAGMANVLQVTMGSSAFDWVQANGKWTMPAIGESRAFRVYTLNAIPTSTTSWSNAHPIESKGTDGSISGNFYAMHVGSAGTGGIWDFAVETPGWPWNHINVKTGRTADTPGPIAKAVTRIEWKWTRVSATGYTLDLRLYDAAGRLLYDRNSLYGWEAGTLASYTGTFTLDSWAVTGLRIGSNGGFALAGQPKVYWGGFAVCADWCGPYAAGR